MLMFPNIVAFLFFPNCQKQDYIVAFYFFQLKITVIYFFLSYVYFSDSRGCFFDNFFSPTKYSPPNIKNGAGSLTVSYFKITLQAL